MVLTAENILFTSARLLVFSILASKTAGKAGIPVLLLFLAVFATFPLIAGIEKSNLIFNVVFFIVLSSVALQATTLP
jgi:NhaP-type Na+/H+ and K+/H+ antiporter